MLLTSALLIGGDLGTFLLDPPFPSWIFPLSISMSVSVSGLLRDPAHLAKTTLASTLGSSAGGDRSLVLLRRSAAPPSTPAPTPAICKNLALDTSSGDSFYSCPDLSSLQISEEPAAIYGPDGLDQDTNTELPRSPSSDQSAPRDAKKRSKSQAVSQKARGVIGKVRAFQRIAAAKMAQPSIKIDTNVQASKRGPPADLDAGLDAAEQGDPRLETGNTEDVPPFLCQSVSGE